ncbi:glycoside hydrolase family 31 protein [Kitasatospora azatica]|uniref:glycoside hydrolase family 31 protein n=1 Tax=Kitasatospora azatica TaxID=58347 RepID=UPI000A07BBFC|nr:TIM-barrel domain-containing protein [Kitasatospora azatica]
MRTLRTSRHLSPRTTRTTRHTTRTTLTGAFGGVLAILLALLGGQPAAHAATPSAGTLSLSGTHTLNWQGHSYPSGSVPDPAHCPTQAQDPQGATCDHFDLTVDVPAGYWQQNPDGGVPLSINWPDANNDFDLYIYDSAGHEVAESAGSTDPEATVIPNASGTYHVLVVPYAVTNSGYSATASIPTATTVGNATAIAPTNDGNGSTTGYEIQAGAARARIEFTSEDVFRLQLAPDGTFTDPAGREMVTTAPSPLKTTREFDAGDYYAVASKDLVLRAYKSPLRFALYRADNRTVVWQETRGLTWTEDAMQQTLARGPQEQFYGAGEQNGSFSHRDQTVHVANNFNWNEGGYNNSQPFYLSSAGYGVFRNTFAPGVYDFGDRVHTSAQERRFDGYFMTSPSGPDLKAVIGQYTDLVGKPFMPPVYGLEPGDSDCYLHNANRGERHTLDALKVADGYTANQDPLGWMLVNDGYGCGDENLQQTGQGLRDHNMQLGLWTSTGLPNQGEEVKAGVRVRKLDVGWVGPGYQFALDGCMQAKAGIEQNSDARGFVWLPVSWAGAQRCGVLWSGDQTGSYNYVKWQIPTYAGSTMSGIAYNTGDVGGIFGSDPRVETRDLEWKTFIPTIMTMDGWAKSDKQPWQFGQPYTSVNTKYLQLKERLLPYLYTLAAQAHQSGVGAVRPLVLEYPNDPNTWGDAAKYEFLSGKDFLVAPVYDASETRDGIYLPQGTWVDYWTGKTYQGPTTINGYHAPLDTLPLFVRAGAIVPMWPQGTLSWQTRDTSRLDYDIYAQGNADFTLYEDDGTTRAYQQGASATQQVTVRAAGEGHGATLVTVGPSTGDYAGKPAARSYEFSVHVGAEPATVLLDHHPVTDWSYDSAAGVVHIKTPPESTSSSFSLLLAGAGGIGR